MMMLPARAPHHHHDHDHPSHWPAPSRHAYHSIQRTGKGRSTESTRTTSENCPPPGGGLGPSRNV
eukprot:1971752-Rhodomonas_salina.1